MKKDFSTSWKSSKQPRKQKKYLANAPLHLKQKFVSSHLSKDLKTKHKKRSLGVRKGDTVKIMRGQFKKKTGKVDRVDLKSGKIYIESVVLTKKDGSKRPYPLNPSNLLILELNLGDENRQKILKRK